MDGDVRPGDVIVCRVNGTSDLYVVGTVVSGRIGELSLCCVSTTTGRDAALALAYRGSDERMPASRVWLFDGAAAGYVKTVVPPGLTSVPSEGAATEDDLQLQLSYTSNA